MKAKLLTLTFLLLSVVVFAQSEQEKQALTDLYVATQGEQWVQTWDLSQPISEWHGVTVENNQVVAINLLFNNLEGTIPNSIGDLQHLTRLELSFNKISGNLPAAIGKLKKLEILAFNGNNLNGTIPTQLGSLISLEELHLSSNELCGLVPLSFGEMKKLKVLNLFDNELTGTLPYNLLNNKNLEQLVIAENNITNTQAFAEIMIFDENKESLFKKDSDIAPAGKKVMAIETSDDDN